MAHAVNTVEKFGVRQIIIAVPTAHDRTLREMQNLQDTTQAIYCPNIRTGYRFAVADAYVNWTDISEQQSVEILTHFEE